MKTIIILSIIIFQSCITNTESQNQKTDDMFKMPGSETFYISDNRHDIPYQVSIQTVEGLTTIAFISNGRVLETRTHNNVDLNDLTINLIIDNIPAENFCIAQ